MRTVQLSRVSAILQSVRSMRRQQGRSVIRVCKSLVAKHTKRWLLSCQNTVFLFTLELAMTWTSSQSPTDLSVVEIIGNNILEYRVTLNSYPSCVVYSGVVVADVL